MTLQMPSQPGESSSNSNVGIDAVTIKPISAANRATKLPSLQRWNNAIVPLAWLTVGLFLLFIVNFAYFGMSLANVDSLLFYSSFSAARHFGSLFDLQTFAFGQGFGAFQHPTIYNLFWWIQDVGKSVQFSYVATEFLFLASIFAFAYWLSQSMTVALVGAWLATAFYFFPLLSVDYFAPVAPQVLLQIGFSYLALALIGSGLARPIWIVPGFAVLLLTIMMDWLYVLFVLPILAIGLFVILISGWFDRRSKPARQMTWLFIGCAATSVLILASGLVNAYNSFTMMSLRAWAIRGDFSDARPSMLLWGGVTHNRLAPYVVACAILAMIYIAWLRQAFWHLLCLSCLVWLGLLIIADIDSTGSNIYWSLPRVGYFERALIPFYAIVLVYAAAELGGRATSWFGTQPAARTICAAFRRPWLLCLLFVLTGISAFSFVSIWAETRGPGPAIYLFEKQLLPIYAAVIAGAITGIARLATLRTNVNAAGAPIKDAFRRPPRPLVLFPIAGIVALCMVAAWLKVSGQSIREMIYRPPYYWERTANFVEQLLVARPLNRAFNPYFFDGTREHLINNCPQLHDPDQPARSERYCGEMMNLHSARNFFEFQNLQDIQIWEMFRQADAVVQRTLGPNSASSRRGSTIDRLKALKAFGIRYVAIDGKDEEASVVISIEGKSVSLLDLQALDVSDLSVLSLKYQPLYDTNEVINARFEGTAVIHDKAAFDELGHLVPGTSIEIAYRHGSVEVHARSPGISIVLLPFQFSHCLYIADDKKRESKLLRLNGGQAALHFVQEADVVIANGLTYFGRTRCRERDFADAFRLHLSPVYTYEQYAAGKYVPLLMELYLKGRIRFRNRILGEPS